MLVKNQSLVKVKEHDKIGISETTKKRGRGGGGKKTKGVGGYGDFGKE